MSVHAYRLGGGTLRWMFVIDLPTLADAKRRQKVRRGFRSQTDAEVAEANAIRTHGSSTPAADGSIEAVLLQWCDYGEINLRQTSYGWYRSMVRTYIAPHIGGLPMHMLDDTMVNKLYRKLLKCGNKHGGPLSQSTVRGVHKTISAAATVLKIKLGDGVRIPPPNKMPGRHGTWTKAQCVAFLTFVSDDRLFAAWVLAVVCGMRRGELAGLRWRDIDFDDNVVRIRKQRNAPNGGGVIEQDPKGTSERDIPMGPLVAAILLAWKQIWNDMQFGAGDRWQGGDRVFVYDRGRSRGRTYHPSYFTHRFSKLCDLANVPRIALHDGRHTTATIGGANGVDIKSMQANLGHADAKILTNIYMKLVDEARRVAAGRIEAAMLQPAPVDRVVANADEYEVERFRAFLQWSRGAESQRTIEGEAVDDRALAPV